MISEDRYSQDVDNGPDFDLSGKITIAAIAIMLAVAIFILCLPVCVRFSRQRSIGSSGRPDGSSRRRRFVFAGDRDLARLRRVGLERSVIESLPVFVYQSANHKDGLECAVCLCEFEEKEKGKLLPKCNHSFHIDCIDMWFHSHSTCPLCRASARPDASSAVTVVVAGESSGTDSATDGEASSSVTVDGHPSEQRGGETAPETGENDGLCDSCRSDDGLPSPTYATNGLFWGGQNQKNSSKLDQATSSRKPSGKIVIDIPRRTENFSSPRPISVDKRQVYSPGGPSSKSPSIRLCSLKLLLSRDKRVLVQSPDGVDAEQGGQAKC